jgi:hypothetical protein
MLGICMMLTLLASCKMDEADVRLEPSPELSDPRFDEKEASGDGRGVVRPDTSLATLSGGTPGYAVPPASAPDRGPLPGSEPSLLLDVALSLGVVAGEMRPEPAAGDCGQGRGVASLEGLQTRGVALFATVPAWPRPACGI